MKINMRKSIRIEHGPFYADIGNEGYPTCEIGRKEGGGVIVAGDGDIDSLAKVIEKVIVTMRHNGPFSDEELIPLWKLENNIQLRIINDPDATPESAK